MPVVISDADQGGIYIVNKYEKLASVHSTWKSHWDQLSEFFLPQKDQVYGQTFSKGEKKDNLLFDSVGVRSCEQLASALHGMLTNPSTVWFALSSGDPKIDSVQAVAEWLQDSARRMIAVMNASNFQTEIHEVFLDLVGIGTSDLTIEEDPDDVVRFMARPIYESAISENYLGVVDTVYCCYRMTLEQVVEKYGDTVPLQLRQAKDKNPLHEVDIIYAVEPTKRLPKSLQHAMQPITTVHVLKNEKVVLEKKGFNEMPKIIPRFSKISGEMYGRSPAMKALADVRMANAMKKAIIENAQLTVAPPVQVPDEGVLLPIKIAPRSTNYYRAGTKDRIEKMDIGGDVRISDALLEKVHDDIKKAFYIDQLHLVENDRMTATEVMQRRDEQLRAMSPILGRLQHELLSPLVMRVFGIMSRRGLIAPVPEELKNASLEVKFVSQLARAQESVDGDNFLRAFAAASQVATVQPSSMDYFNGDEAVKFLMKTFGAPLYILRKEADVAKLREQQAMQQQMMEQQQNLLAATEAQKNLAQAQR